MTTASNPGALDDNGVDDDHDDHDRDGDALQPDPPRPVNWNLLPADDLHAEWAELDAWVTWLRRTYGLTASVVPPYWHRHPELLWELSALHLHWLSAYHPDQHGSAPIGWHRDFADARERLRDWTAASGTRLDRDRPTRQTLWPGEQPTPTHQLQEQTIDDRYIDFLDYVAEQVAERDLLDDWCEDPDQEDLDR